MECINVSREEQPFGDEWTLGGILYLWRISAPVPKDVAHVDMLFRFWHEEIYRVSCIIGGTWFSWTFMHATTHIFQKWSFSMAHCIVMVPFVSNLEQTLDSDMVPHFSMHIIRHFMATFRSLYILQKEWCALILYSCKNRTSPRVSSHTTSY